MVAERLREPAQRVADRIAELCAIAPTEGQNKNCNPDRRLAERVLPLLQTRRRAYFSRERAERAAHAVEARGRYSGSAKVKRPLVRAANLPHSNSITWHFMLS